MTVQELCRACANTGAGTIKIINGNNVNDDAKFDSLQELEKTPLKRFKVRNWEFVPKRRLGAIDWEFVLEITVI